jgi:succinate-semialdehyde dehydrogenase/glutarate-semialdehyde dehydrogenase
MGRIWRVSGALEFGMIGINNANLSSATTPFGGMKESGIGREGGYWGLDEYLEVKFIGMGY